jgi:hypothetical protein
VVPEDATTVPIGAAISNTQLYVLDSLLQPVPIGVPGELYVGGDGLARGYLNRPDLTAELFVSNPFRPAARLYKTGDRVRWQADGNLEFLGRLDQQVKLRGFRIELGEVETVLRQHPDVRETVALVREDAPDEKRLVAYLIPRNGKPLLSSDLRSYLQRKLPDYMVPSLFLQLETLPHAEWKIDRRALPAPKSRGPRPHDSYAAPRTPRRNRSRRSGQPCWVSNASASTTASFGRGRTLAARRASVCRPREAGRAQAAIGLAVSRSDHRPVGGSARYGK